MYEDNFVVGGALDKVATACSTGFLPLTKKDQKDAKAAALDNMLKNLTADLEYYFLSMLVTGNAFAEVALDLLGEPHLLPCMTSEMYVKISSTDATIEGKDGKYKVLQK